MTWTRETAIFCDVCGNWERVTGTVKKARRKLRGRGWRHELGADICPSCVEALVGKRRAKP
jgi:hypothetical protein